MNTGKNNQEEKQYMPNYYKILGVSASASTEEIHAAYEAKCKMLHLDVNQSDDAFYQKHMLDEAHNELTHSMSRSIYDALHKWFCVKGNGRYVEADGYNGSEAFDSEWWDEVVWKSSPRSGRYVEHRNGSNQNWLIWLVTVAVICLIIYVITLLFNL